ncbi:MAG: hypothetical protein KF855_07705 [Acidobacteria bacterium]|nr:hypothetical protein [Acidobacteriota bacterium]
MIQKTLFFGAVFFAAFFVFGSVEINAQTTPVVGSYQKAKKSDKAVKEAADFAVKGQGENFRLIKISKAEKQVVAGVNFRVRLRVAEKGGDNESKYYVTAVIYRDLEGKFSVTSWEKE